MYEPKSLYILSVALNGAPQGHEIGSCDLNVNFVCCQKAFVEPLQQLAAANLGQHATCADPWVVDKGMLPVAQSQPMALAVLAPCQYHPVANCKQLKLAANQMMQEYVKCMQQQAAHASFELACV